jgi:hypothetical protein
VAENRGLSGPIHERPLPKMAIDVLAGVTRFKGCWYVFSNDGVTALGGYGKPKAKFDKACGVTGWRLHDLRRTARSLMSRAGADKDHSERCEAMPCQSMNSCSERAT